MPYPLNPGFKQVKSNHDLNFVNVTHKERIMLNLDIKERGIGLETS